VCAIASVFVPGLGQILCGQVTKGAVIFGVAFFSVGFCGILNLLAAFDAWRISERRARGEVVADWQFF
jgi:TM2 domain-containing membrane protein YozV